MTTPPLKPLPPNYKFNDHELETFGQALTSIGGYTPPDAPWERYFTNPIEARSKLVYVTYNILQQLGHIPRQDEPGLMPPEIIDFYDETFLIDEDGLGESMFDLNNGAAIIYDHCRTVPTGPVTVDLYQRSADSPFPGQDQLVVAAYPNAAGGKCIAVFTVAGELDRTDGPAFMVTDRDGNMSAQWFRNDASIEHGTGPMVAVGLLPRTFASQHAAHHYALQCLPDRTIVDVDGNVFSPRSDAQSIRTLNFEAIDHNFQDGLHL